MNREDLEYDIIMELGHWDGKSDFTLAGVNDISRDDIDLLLICCDWHEEHGTLDNIGRLRPKVMEVLGHYGMT